MTRLFNRALIGAVAVGSFLAITPAAFAQSDANLFKGKTITFLVPYPPGGSYDAYARLVQAHMSQYIPGNPKIIVQNMGGGGGSKGTNFFYRTAPKDGTMLLFPPDAYAISPILQPKRAKHDPTKLISIGSIVPVNPVVMVRSDAEVTTVEGLRKTEIPLACSGRSSQSFIMPAAMKHLLGFKWKLICGYKGSAPMGLALKRGEVHGQSSAWASWRIREADLIKSGDIIPVVQIGLARETELPDVPLMQELTKDPKTKQALMFLSTGSAIGRSMVAAPDTDKDRVAALRQAFGKVMEDSAFLADAKKRRALVRPTAGAKIQALVDAAQNTPQDVIDLAKLSQTTKAEKCTVNCTKPKKK